MDGKSIFKNTKGQVTIFIILAIVIVVIGALIYAFFPKIKSSMGLETRNPYSYMQSCLNDKVEAVITNLSLQGGSINPEGSYLYLGNNLEYLCYTNEYYKLCKVQEPFIKEHIEKEITKSIMSDVQNCFNSLTENYKKRGYGVLLKDGTIKTDILPRKTLISLGYQLELKKSSTKNYDKFNIVLNNNLYNFSNSYSSYWGINLRLFP